MVCLWTTLRVFSTSALSFLSLISSFDKEVYWASTAGSSGSCRPILTFLMLFSRFVYSGHSSNNWDFGNFSLDFLAWRTWFGKIPRIMGVGKFHSSQWTIPSTAMHWRTSSSSETTFPSLYIEMYLFPSCRFLLFLNSVPVFCDMVWLVGLLPGGPVRSGGKAA